jgi:hypothetical protein
MLICGRFGMRPQLNHPPKTIAMTKPTPQAQAKLTVIFDDKPDRPIEMILSGTAEGIDRLCHLYHSGDGLRVVGVERCDTPISQPIEGADS